MSVDEIAEVAVLMASLPPHVKHARSHRPPKPSSCISVAADQRIVPLDAEQLRTRNRVAERRVLIKTPHDFFGLRIDLDQQRGCPVPPWQLPIT